MCVCVCVSRGVVQGENVSSAGKFRYRLEML